jgi:hypothetical protein
LTVKRRFVVSGENENQIGIMKNQLVTKLLAGGSLILLVAAFAGCSSCKPGKPGSIGRYTVNVSLDESLKSSSVLVDLVGVNPSGLPRWEAYDMGKYWREGDPMRHDADKVVLNFVSGQTLTNSLSVTNATWDRWKSQGVSHVLVLADITVRGESRPGNQDARRQILSLDQCQWPTKTKVLNVLVQRSGIKVLTPARTVQ